MKQGIHPNYFPKATVLCQGCNTTYTVGSTRESTQVELCSNCHPFYTGKQKLVDTAGRVDRFRARQAKARSVKAPAKSPTKSNDSPAVTADGPVADATVAPSEETNEQ